ncbi:hypothetical protein HanRHA438_Chr02g0084621 [Helianthus annuus]|nr:hypothetical protein HanRHA438_Chr02g0084621 [Helianthus annuus]
MKSHDLVIFTHQLQHIKSIIFQLIKPKINSSLSSQKETEIMHNNPVKDLKDLHLDEFK